MGLNDLQAQINRLGTMQKRGFALIDNLNHGVASAMQNAATAAGYLPPASIGAGGGGGAEVEWGTVVGTMQYNVLNSSAQEGTAVLMETTSSGAAQQKNGGASVGIFTFDRHNSYTMYGGRVNLVKDDVYTAYKATAAGGSSSMDWYRVLNPMQQDVFVRMTSTSGTIDPSPLVNSVPSWQGDGGKFRIYRKSNQTPTSSHTTGTYGYYQFTTTTAGQVINRAGASYAHSVATTRVHLGCMPNTKDIYNGLWFELEEQLILTDVACIMAYVGTYLSPHDGSNYIAPEGTAGCVNVPDARGDITSYAYGSFYPMGTRRNIFGQFTANCAKGDTQNFKLAKWNKQSPKGGAAPATPGDGDFEQETIYGYKLGSLGGNGALGNWDIEFARGQVWNASGFGVHGDEDFGDGDLCAAQYDDENGVYLAAPLRT